MADKKQKQHYFYGYIILDTGAKIHFNDLPEYEYDYLWDMVNGEYYPESHSYIYLNNDSILTDRIAGYRVNSYES